MKKKLLILGLITALSLSITACGNDTKKEEKKDDTKTTETIEENEVKENKLIGGEEIGTGKVNLVNESGSSEDENTLYVMYDKEAILVQLGIESENMDGSQPTIIYLDGKEVTKEQLGDTQTNIELKDKALEKGIHNVEFIQKDGDTVTFYHLAKYEVK